MAMSERATSEASSYDTAASAAFDGKGDRPSEKKRSYPASDAPHMRLPVSLRQRRLARRERAGQRAADATRARPAMEWAARTVLRWRELRGCHLERATKVAASD